MMDFKERMTNAQREGVEKSQEISRELAIKLLIQAHRMYDAANVKLPMKNEQGLPVVHGCRFWCLNIARNYRDAALSLLQNLPVDIQDDITRGYEKVLRMR
jgi:hypothetical protein